MHGARQRAVAGRIDLAMREQAIRQFEHDLFGVGIAR